MPFCPVLKRCHPARSHSTNNKDFEMLARSTHMCGTTRASPRNNKTSSFSLSTMYSQSQRKASRFLVRHRARTLFQKLVPPEDTVQMISRIDSLLNRLGHSRDAHAYLSLSSDQEWPVQLQRQNLYGVTLFPVLSQQTTTTPPSHASVRILVEVRYLFRWLSHRFQTKEVHQESQTLSELASLHR